MKTIKLFVSILLVFGLCYSASPQDAADIIRKADAKMKGEKSSFSIMTMKVIRPGWNRVVTFKTWTKGTEYSLVLVLSPANEKGQSFLKRGRDMWNWNPVINRMIKFPPSMLSQGWMGSDFTNDDLLNESSIVVDYYHKLLGEETVSESDCYKIELSPKENAPVVWGKIIAWVSKYEYLQLKTEYYDEDEFLVKTEIASNIRNMDGRIIPTYFELIPEDKSGFKTILSFDNITFNIPIEDNFFSQQNMKLVR